MNETEVIDTKTGEVMQELVVVSNAPKDTMDMLVKEADRPVFNAMASMDTLDWKNLRPNQMAVLLMQRPMSVSGGGVMYLNFKQALLFAVRCFELGLSPFSDSVWFDTNRSAVNLTLSGKRELARIRGIDLGPPQFEELYREWKDVPKITESGEDAKKAGFTKDAGCRCTIRVGDIKNGEHVTYTAWINDWFVSRSPVWKARPNHMLTIRANEKAVTLALGTGASALPDERELE